MLLFFVRIILPTDAEVVALPEVVIDGEVDGLLVGAVGGVVEAECFTVERIGVVGEKDCTIVHFQSSNAIGLEVADMEFCLFVVAGFVELATDLCRFALLDTLLDRHCGEREVVCL